MDSTPLLLGMIVAGALLILVLLLVGWARRGDYIVDLPIVFLLAIWFVLVALLVWAIAGQTVIEALEKALPDGGAMLLTLPFCTGTVLLVVLLAFTMLFEIRSRAIIEILEKILEEIRISKAP